MAELILKTIPLRSAFLKLTRYGTLANFMNQNDTMVLVPFGKKSEATSKVRYGGETYIATANDKFSPQYGESLDSYRAYLNGKGDEFFRDLDGMVVGEIRDHISDNENILPTPSEGSETTYAQILRNRHARSLGNTLEQPPEADPSRIFILYSGKSADYPTRMYANFSQSSNGSFRYRLDDRKTTLLIGPEEFEKFGSGKTLTGVRQLVVPSNWVDYLAYPDIVEE